MKRIAVILCWIAVAVTGILLRFDDLAKRPVHADEATGARITATRMAGGGKFDPKHYHGPLLGDLAIPLCRARGEHGWKSMTKESLRILPAAAGSLVLLLPLCWRRRFGDGPMLLAAACLATSPLLVYYSRMFIHEMLLVLFGMLAVVTFGWKPKWGLTGVLLGLMFAVKETFAISVMAWSGAALLLALENRRALAAGWRDRQAWLVPAAISGATAVLTALVFYTRGFTHLEGAVDAVKTYFVYEVVTGHDKPFGYYFDFLAVPANAAGLWWFESGVLVLALAAFGMSFAKQPAAVAGNQAGEKLAVRFLAYSAAGHFLIYSVISYKTPWLACLPWAHVCLLAGFAVHRFARRRILPKAALGVLAVAVLILQTRLARQATGRLEADERNPYAYSPTQQDVERLAVWFGKIRAVTPAGALEPAAVVGTDYWPLPWYLREFARVGYWADAPAGLDQMPVVLVMTEHEAEVNAALAATHVSLPRGLRADVPVVVFLRNDIWQAWMNAD